MANEPGGSPGGVGLSMQAKGSFPVIPLYLPVPPVMRWVPQSISGCDLSRSRPALYLDSAVHAKLDIWREAVTQLRVIPLNDALPIGLGMRGNAGMESPHVLFTR